MTSPIQKFVSGFLAHPPSFNDLNTGVPEEWNEQFYSHDAKAVDAAVSKSDTPRSVSMRHNKADPDWPQFEGLDIHKIDVTDHTREKKRIMDTNTGTSIWEEHLKSQAYMHKNKGTPIVNMSSPNPRMNPNFKAPPPPMSPTSSLDQRISVSGEDRARDAVSELIQQFGTD